MHTLLQAQVHLLDDEHKTAVVQNRVTHKSQNRKELWGNGLLFLVSLRPSGQSFISRPTVSLTIANSKRTLALGE